MPKNNEQNTNINRNGAQQNPATLIINPERLNKHKIARAKKLEREKKRAAFRIANKGKFDNLRKQLASFKETRDKYIRIQNRKLAEKMAEQNKEQKPENVTEQVNGPKPESAIKPEDNLVIEEPKAKEEPQKLADEMVKENNEDPLYIDDIEVTDADLEDPALDDELEKLEQLRWLENGLKIKVAETDF